MEQNVKKEMNIVDLWRVFTKNIVLLIVITLVGAIVGGALGGVLAYTGASYEATLKFSLTPTDDTDALLYNLQSEAFAEKLLLDENGLPEKSECDPEDYAAALAAVEAFNAAREEKLDIKKQINRHQTSVVEYKKAHYDQEYEKIVALLNTYKSAPSESVANAESHKAMIESLESQLNVIIEARNEVIQEYNAEMLIKTELQESFTLASIKVSETRRQAEELTEKVLAPWRESADVSAKISAIMSSVTYEYAKLETTDATATKNNTQNKGYIKINVSVEDDRELAIFIVERLKERVSSFVELHVEQVTSSARVDCVLISTFSEPQKNGDNLVVNAVKFAAIIGIVAFVIGYVVLVFKKTLSIYAEDEADAKDKIESAEKTDE